MTEKGGVFSGPIKVDETYFGGKRANMSNAKRRKLKDMGRGAVGKTAVAGLKDRTSNNVRARVVRRTDSETLQNFVTEHTAADTIFYSDDATA